MSRERPRQQRRREAQDRARALAFLLTILAVLLSFYRVYWSLGVFSLSFGVVLVITRRGSRALRASIAIGYLCVAVLFLLWPLREQHREELRNQTSGELHVTRPSAEAPVAQVGSSSARFVWTANPVSPIFGFFRAGEKILNIDVANREIQVSTEVRDTEGNLVLKMDHNKWTITPSAVADYNYTRDALEVKDRRNQVVFQVHLLPDHVELQGEWRDKQGQGLELVQCPAPRIADFAPLAAHQTRDVPIAPLFLYPRSTRWAEWNRDRAKQLPNCDQAPQ